MSKDPVLPASPASSPGCWETRAPELDSVGLRCMGAAKGQCAWERLPQSCLLRAHGGVSLTHSRGPLCSLPQGLSRPLSGWAVFPSVPKISALAHVKLPSAFPLPTPAAHWGDKEPEVPNGPREEVVEAGWKPGPFLQPLWFRAGMAPGGSRVVWHGVAFPQGEWLCPGLWRAGAGRTPSAAPGALCLPLPPAQAPHLPSPSAVGSQPTQTLLV